MDESDYYYRDIIEGASDADSVDSSDDDTDYRRLFEHGKHLSDRDREVLRGMDDGAYKDNDDEDSNLSFEREMENEARNHVNGVHVNTPPSGFLVGLEQVQSSSTRFPASATAARSLTSAAAAGTSLINLVASTSRTREQENDELLYDPDEDDRDQKWADAHRAMHSAPPPPPPSIAPESLASGSQGHQKKATLTLTSELSKKYSKLKDPQSDATLNCPCCLTLLCLDCQRHELYRTQYRAMFVLNCRVDYGRKLLHRDKEQRREPFKRSKKRQKKLKTEKKEEEKEPETQPSTLAEDQEQQSTDAAASDLYHPVHCTVCNTQVALFDTNEVFHFFSVIASH